MIRQGTTQLHGGIHSSGAKSRTGAPGTHHANDHASGRTNSLGLLALTGLFAAITGGCVQGSEPNDDLVYDSASTNTTGNSSTTGTTGSTTTAGTGTTGTATAGAAATGSTTTTANQGAGGAATDDEPAMQQDVVVTMPEPDEEPTVGGYYVQGNQILDANGNVHRFYGVNRPSFEWSTMGQAPGEAVYRAIRGWGANIVRIPVNQTYWMNDEGGYRANLDVELGQAERFALDVIFDLHWHDVGSEQENMARRDAIDFWRAFADYYKDNPRVLFELYNEPHDVFPDTWRDGDGTWAGMQEMADAVRSTGAENIILIGGLDWAFDLSSVGAGFTGSNIAYATHIYDFSNKQADAWPRAFSDLANSAPVIITEFGTDNGVCSANFETQVLDYADQRGMSWVAWAWFPADCGFPSLIEDWEGRTPTVKGEAIRSRLASYQ